MNRESKGIGSYFSAVIPNFWARLRDCWNRNRPAQKANTKVKIYISLSPSGRFEWKFFYFGLIVTYIPLVPFFTITIIKHSPISVGAAITSSTLLGLFNARIHDNSEWNILIERQAVGIRPNDRRGTERGEVYKRWRRKEEAVLADEIIIIKKGTRYTLESWTHPQLSIMYLRITVMLARRWMVWKSGSSADTSHLKVAVVLKLTDLSRTRLLLDFDSCCKKYGR